MLNCLIVDDSNTVRKAIRRIMETFQFDCDEAEDGKEALDRCNLLMPDLIMLDWNMPVMNGFEFLQNLRKRPDGGSPKVIFCTTENNMNHIMEGMSAGADEYIMKPFDAAIIQEKLVQVGVFENEF